MEQQTQQLTTKVDNPVFSVQGFEHAQRIAMMISKSSMIPASYQNRVDNCMVALEFANRSNTSPLMVMQNLHVIQGRPSWSSTYIIGLINSSGRIKDKLKFRSSGEGDDYGYEAYAKDFDGTELVGPKVDWKMVKAEGWLSKTGSKWKTMPELMFQYRAAAFFGRLHTPELMLGMQSVEEVIDVKGILVDDEPKPQQDNKQKEHERMVKLINSSTTIEQLEALSPDVEIEQLDLFEHRKQQIKDGLQ